MNKGFLWTFEWLIGMVAITGLLVVASTHSMPEQSDSLPSVLCHDVLNVWVSGGKVETITQELLPKGTYSFSTVPFSNFSSDGVVCHATRIQNGIMEEMFLRIEA